MDSNLKEKIESLRALLDALEGDVAKSDEGTLAAGGRVRKQLQELKRVTQEARLFCLERDHARKTTK
jgi:hypothetical protein